MRTQHILIVSLVLSLGLLLCACQKNTKNTGSETSPVAYKIKMGVVPFSQPHSTAELISGQLPKDQGNVPQDVLIQLDSMLRHSLTPTKHLYSLLPTPQSLRLHDLPASEVPKALEYWIAYGKEQGLDMLLVPQILVWHQRQGSRAGVTHSAHIRAEFFLLDVRGGTIYRRSVFEEKQVGLVDNILEMGTFFKRGAGWVTAEELTQEAIDKAIKELGL